MAEIARYRRVSSLGTAEKFREHLESLGVSLECDDEILTAPDSPLAQPAAIGERVAGNRFAIQPMEGWDGTEEGDLTDLVRRRWANFGRSGAKLIWGCLLYTSDAADE